MKFTRIILVLLAGITLFSLTACKSDAEKFVTYFEDMAQLIEDNKGDCDKMGEALQGFADDNGKDLEELKKKLKDMPKEEQKEMREKFESRMEDAEKKMESIGECAMNEKVQKAMETLM